MQYICQKPKQIGVTHSLNTQYQKEILLFLNDGFDTSEFQFECNFSCVHTKNSK